MLDSTTKELWDSLQVAEDFVLKTPRIMMQDLGNLRENHLFVLRDDLLPIYLGGNKARKAFFYKQQFLINQVDCVMTYGTVKSNHARAIALLASELNIDSYLICPEQDYAQNLNSKIRALTGMQVISCRLEEVRERIERQMDHLLASYKNPYFIPGGGHDFTGTAAMVDLMFRIAQWEQKEGVRFDRIYFASGTGGTQAGLLLGDAILAKTSHRQHHLIGISIARQKERGVAAIKEAVEQFELGISEKIELSEINFNTDYILGGYGKSNSHLLSLLREMILSYQLPLDPTYTGKAFYGMIRELGKVKNKNILFIHTGGTPLFYDFLEAEKPIGELNGH